MSRIGSGAPARAGRAGHDRQVRRVILIEGLVNLLVLTIKLLVGFGTGSLAILADAVHSLTDVANNVIAWLVVRVAEQPPDREHPYGHRKFETLAVFGLATLLTVLAFELALNALRRDAQPITQSSLGLGLMLAVLALNVGLAWWQRRWARRLNSDILLADASHTFADVLTTVVVLVGWQLSARGLPWLDTVCALAVAALVLYLAYQLFRRAIPVLVDRVAVDPESLGAAVRGVAGVRRVRRLRSRWQGSVRAVDMIVTVDPHLSSADAHAVADAIESRLEAGFQIEDITIHVEPDQDPTRRSR